MKDKLKGFFGTSEETPETTSTDENYYTTSKEDYHDQNGMAGSKMMLLEPRAYSESQQIADYFNTSKHSVSVIIIYGRPLRFEANEKRID